LNADIGGQCFFFGGFAKQVGVANKLVTPTLLVTPLYAVILAIL
jgi:hypothetical protein